MRGLLALLAAGHVAFAEEAVVSEGWAGGVARRLVEYKNDYNKPQNPADSSKNCFDAAQRIRAVYYDNPVDATTGKRYPVRGCMACDPTIGAPETLCQPTSDYDCQTLIDDLYLACRGKARIWPVPDDKPMRMPDGFFFDPLDSLDGVWGPDVEASLKVMAERCGCDAAARATVAAALAAAALMALAALAA